VQPARLVLLRLLRQPRGALDHVMARAVQVAPRPAALGDEGAIENDLAQAGPRRRACIEAASVSRFWMEAGTTAMASQVPPASTSATRLRPSTFLPGS
jgi:hypothetical protein